MFQNSDPTSNRGFCSLCHMQTRQFYEIMIIKRGESSKLKSKGLNVSVFGLKYNSNTKFPTKSQLVILKAKSVFVFPNI